jgi:preprotein translocase subunit SecF|tara:strand:- start:4263 stop:4583 length:321 start_codon:yes stop_codon:yes gene_type:complete
MKHFVYLLIILVLALLISNILSYFTRQLEGIDNCSEKKKAMVSDNKAKINSMTKTLNEMKVAYENLDKKADKNKTMNQANKQKQNEKAEKDKAKVKNQTGIDPEKN